MRFSVSVVARRVCAVASALAMGRSMSGCQIADPAGTAPAATVEYRPEVALDIRDPYSPKETGYYIPAMTEKTDQRCVKDASGQRCKRAIQTNNVEVDDRGYIYIVDRADTGVHILELMGPARAVANFK
jgi:hypothetical protein